MATEQLQCFNKTCGQMYREEENHDEACCYHPGQPVFHDGFKGWDCCERKTRDFSLFMEFKGCKTIFYLVYSMLTFIDALILIARQKRTT